MCEYDTLGYVHSTLSALIGVIGSAVMTHIGVSFDTPVFTVITMLIQTHDVT